MIILFITGKIKNFKCTQPKLNKFIGLSAKRLLKNMRPVYRASRNYIFTVILIVSVFFLVSHLPPCNNCFSLL